MTIWKPISKCPQFEISNDGQIKNTRTGKILKQTVSRTGYFGVVTRPINMNNKCIRFVIHREVTLAFIPNPEDKPEVNHIDGNKLNNDVNNLEWVTRSENMIHAYKNNLASASKGEKSGSSVLTDEIVLTIRNEYIPRHKQFGCRALAKKYNVHHTTIMRTCSDTCKQKNWKHI